VAHAQVQDPFKAEINRNAVKAYIRNLTNEFIIGVEAAPNSGPAKQAYDRTKNEFGMHSIVIPPKEGVMAHMKTGTAEPGTFIRIIRPSVVVDEIGDIAEEEVGPKKTSDGGTTWYASRAVKGILTGGMGDSTAGEQETKAIEQKKFLLDTICDKLMMSIDDLKTTLDKLKSLSDNKFGYEIDEKGGTIRFYRSKN